MNLLAKPAELTGFLEPTPQASAADLRAARLALAYAMLGGQKENTHALAPPGNTSQALSPVLPRDGQWSVVRNPARRSDGAEALDRDFGVPLVREGPATWPKKSARFSSIATFCLAL